MEPDNSAADSSQLQDEQDARLAQANRLYQTGVLLIYGRRKAVDKAIKCIQKAITLIDSDYKYWQLLGEAYYQRGSLNPSINSFMKSLALAENESTKLDHLETTTPDEQQQQQKERIKADCTYSRLRMSDIRLSVLHLDEAALGYSDIIQHDPSNVAALVGLARVELQRSRNCFSSGLVKSGHLHCMSALNYSLRATKLSPHLCFTWKLASDCCLTQFIYGQKSSSFTSKISIQFPGSDENGDLVISRLTCIEMAQQFLCKALAIEPFKSSGCLWHNLGISLYLKSTILEPARHEQQRNSLLRRSLKCLFKALDQDRNNSQIRNTIGVVAFHLNHLNTAQNFLIKSIQTNLSTSEIQFSNLGYIYLQKGQFRVASVAFGRCQAEEPLYSRSWLGNALINEQNNLDNLSFLRHCYKLENNYESQMMYATKVTSLPTNTEEFSKDLINALDCMQRLVNYNENSLEVNNTLGLLYERSGYHDQARRCLERAHQLAPQDSRVTFNRLRQHRCNELSSCDPMINPAELSASHSDPSEADLIKAAEKLANGNNPEYMLNFIYYLFKNRDFSQINSRMTKLIERRLPGDDLRSKIGAQMLLALTAKAQGDDFKSWLFKNLIDSENLICLESLANMLCLMLLGTTTNDQQLVEQISQDIGNYLTSYITTRTIQFDKLLDSNEGFWSKFLLLNSIFCCHPKHSSSQLVKSLVVMYPTNAELWLYLGLSMVLQRSSHQLATYCLKKASLIGSTRPDLCHVCDLLLAISSQQQSAAKSSKQTTTKTGTCKRDNPVVHLSNALYKYPDEEVLWKLLESAAATTPPATNANVQGKSPKKCQPTTTFNGDESNLFQLAIDNVIKLLVVS